MLKKSIYNIIYLLASAVMLSSCSENKINEGEIIYEISFPNFSEEDHPITKMLLPKEQNYKFKSNSFLSTIKKATFKLNIYVQTDEKSFYSDLKFNDQIHCLLEDNDTNQIINSLPEYEIEFTNEKDTLAGFNIKKAIADIPHVGKVDIWYTEEIDLDNPNWYNPYNKVPGVLLVYTMYQHGIRMDFKATSYQEIMVPDEVFNISKKGKSVSFEDFNRELAALFHNLIN